MPHQCVRCGIMYEDGSQEILNGCSCGSKFFFFMRHKDVEESKKFVSELKPEERKQIEADVKDLIGPEFDKTKPVVLDLENIRIRKPGQYELDLVELFKGKPLVYKLEEGKYIIDILSMFGK